MTHKGSDTHQSFMGGVLTLAVMAFTIAMVVIKIREVVAMTDPTITTFPRPILESKREELGTIDLKDFSFNIGYEVHVWNSK